MTVFNGPSIILLFVLCNTLVLRRTYADFYSAVVELEGLVKTEASLIEAYKNFVNEEEQKLEFLKRQVAHFEKEHEKAKKEAVEYLANPINIYLLVKRLVTDWKFNETYIDSDVYDEITSIITRLGYTFPDESDLSGTAVALARLQKIYDLSAESLANGELNGVKYNSELSYDDCFELGRQLYVKKEYNESISWIREALRRYDSGNADAKTSKWEIQEYLAYLSYIKGDLQSASNLTSDLLAVSHNTLAEISLQYYQSKIAEENELRSNENNNQEPTQEADSEVKKPTEKSKSKETEEDPTYKYDLLCRKAIQLSANEEELYKEPRILLYHEVLYSNEIEIVKNMAKPKLERSRVRGKNQGVPTEVRTSKIAWLRNAKHPTIAAIRKRVSDMTLLSVDSAESLQVCNYGIGGHYVPHTDYFTNATVFGSSGNRIATVLFYMSNVAQGGATVFPYLDVVVWPEEGTALFWHNLHSSGAPNKYTYHAACPVLQGSKWASNLWLHEVGQEFRRPCDPHDKSALTEKDKD